MAVEGTAWHAPLIRYLLQARSEGDLGTTVADIGCGRFDLGLALGPHGFSVDGFDLAADRREEARAAVARAGLASKVVDSVDQLASGSYDLVCFVGVLHYLEVPDIAAYLGHARRLLRPEGGVVVITDVPAPGHRRFADVRDLLATAIRHRLHRELASLVSSEARDRSLLEWTHLTAEDVMGLARPFGFEVTVCEHNLSPFRQRQSFLLRAGG